MRISRFWQVMVSIDTTNNPFDILGDSETNKVISKVGSENGTTFDLGEIVQLLRAVVLYGSVVVCIMGLIGMLLVYKNDKIIAEKKQSVMHYLFIVWLSASAVTIFNIIKMFLDEAFGFV